MDSVRFGRVLGHGARQAAKTLVSAVDAATAPKPAQPAAPSASPVTRPLAGEAPTRPLAPSASTQANAATHSRPRQPSVAVLPPSAAVRASSTAEPSSAKTVRSAPAAKGLAEGSRRFGRAVWAPAVRLSGVLWLEFTGVFFGLFALIAGIAVWRLHSALFASPASRGVLASPSVAASDDRTRLFFAAGMVLVFGYFSLSSFLKANRRSRRP